MLDDGVQLVSKSMCRVTRSFRRKVEVNSARHLDTCPCLFDVKRALIHRIRRKSKALVRYT